MIPCRKVGLVATNRTLAGCKSPIACSRLPRPAIARIFHDHQQLSDGGLKSAYGAREYANARSLHGCPIGNFEISACRGRMCGQKAASHGGSSNGRPGLHTDASGRSKVDHSPRFGVVRSISQIWCAK